MKNRTTSDYLLITLKGMAMGAADVVPGVSGGTIAFISGIYEELIYSISRMNIELFKVLKSSGIRAAWAYINGPFLLALFIGIAASVFSLARIFNWLLENKPVLVWSFFFGLVLASVILVAREITHWKISLIFLAIAGAMCAWIITELPVLQPAQNTLYFFFAGALAICAMILPGISGAFILVLLGAYKTVLEALEDRNAYVILTLGMGAVVGLLSFSRLLKWLLKNYHQATLAVLIGFIAGSLNKIWPWKQALDTLTLNGQTKIISEQNVWPQNYAGDAQLEMALIMAVGGLLLIFLLERMARSFKKTRNEL